MVVFYKYNYQIGSLCFAKARQVMAGEGIKAKISNKLAKSAQICLIVYAAIVLVLIIMGFVLGTETKESPASLNGNWSWIHKNIGWFFIPLVQATTQYNYLTQESIKYDTSYYGGYIALLIVIFLVVILTPLIYILLSNRIRKLTELAVSDTKVIGSYTALIPVAKITLSMPIEKIDNVSVANSVLFLFTGKAIRIGSTSGIIKIPYVINADEVVAYISKAIENIRIKQVNPVLQKSEPSSNYTESLKKLAELKGAGVITEEEFNKKKSELLNKI